MSQASAHREVEESTSNLAALLLARGQDDDARAEFERVIEMVTRRDGRSSFDLVFPLMGLAKMELDAGNRRAARRYADRAMKLVLPERADHPQVESLRQVIERIDELEG